MSFCLRLGASNLVLKVVVLFLLTTAFKTFSRSSKLNSPACAVAVLSTCSLGIDLHFFTTSVNYCTNYCTVLMCSLVALETCLCGIGSLCFLDLQLLVLALFFMPFR